MPHVSTFCPRCGETIETDVPEEARAAGRAELSCPACKFEFVIAPARRNEPPKGSPEAFVPAGSARSAPARGGADDDAAGSQRAPQAHDATVVRRQDGRAAPSFKPVAAAMMLLFAALIAGWVGGTFAFDPELALIAFTDSPGAGNFTGSVVTPGGDPIEGANVTIVASGEGRGTVRTANGTLHPEDMVGRRTTTADDGRFRFDDLPLGVYTFEITAQGRETFLLEAPSYGGEYGALFDASSTFGRVELREGGPDDVQRDSVVTFFEHVAIGVGWYLLVMAALSIAGAVAAMTRRGYPLAVIGAVAGILSFFAFLVGGFVSIIALVLIILARKEFRPLRRSKDEASE